MTTFEAYNDWGGRSLYGATRADSFTFADRAYKVSFDRPYSYYRGPAWFLEQEYPMVRWLERNGYDVTYATDIDTHELPAMLLRHRAFLSVGHDEYWSKQMRSNVEAALRAGVSLGFFSGNDMSWNIRLEPSRLGPDRVITCYKSASLDPLADVDPSDVTVEWAEAPLKQPQNAVTGVGNGGVIPATHPTGYPLVVTNSTAWPYHGVAVSDGTMIPGMVGYEYDHVVNNGHTPSGLIVLASSPIDTYGKEDIANTTVYTAPSGAVVFAAGTIQWAYGLDSWGAGHADRRIQQITANVLARMASTP